MELRVAKAVALLEFVRGLARTEANLGAVLVDRVDAAAPLPQVKAALERLQEAKFIRNTEEGYKLQTQSEKTWETQRRSLDPRPKDRGEILRDALRELFAAPDLRAYSYRGLRIGLTVDGVRLEDGQVPVSVVTAESPAELPAVVASTQARSREAEHQNELFWVFALSSEIDTLVAEIFRSREMVKKYDQLRGQSKVSPDEVSCVADEKNEVLRYQNRLHEQVSQGLQSGTGLFRGVSKDGSALGNSSSDVFRRWFEMVVPDLYPKLEMGSADLKGNEAEELLKAANLAGLPQVLYEGDDGLGFVRKEGGRYVPNAEAPVAREILGFIQQRASYGEKVTGKDLEQKFAGLGYAWDRDLIQLAAAVLLRAGAVEITHQGRRFRSHQDALSRAPFSGVSAFRSASFAPREAVGLKVLTTAAERYEEITGQEVDVEESAIAQAFKKLAAQEQRELLPVLATARAHRLPADSLLEYETTLQAILVSATDDCVRDLAAQGRSFKEAMARVKKIRQALSDTGLGIIQRARLASESMWPIVRARVPNPGLQEAAAELGSLVGGPTLEALPNISRLASRVEEAYAALYTDLHAKRNETLSAQIGSVKGRADWTEVPREMQEAVIAPLVSRTCAALERSDGRVVCTRCGATLPQMESDIAAVQGLGSAAVSRIQEICRPAERIQRLRLADLVQEPLESEEAISRFVETLRSELSKLLAEGVRIAID